jgi:hypothetical protein
MNNFEAMILGLEQELQLAHRTSLNEKDQSISELREHIRALEMQLYQKDITTTHSNMSQGKHQQQQN